MKAPTSVLLSREEIRNRVSDMGREISRDHRGGTVTLIAILKGSFVFLADLIRGIDAAIPVELDFIAVSSYGDQTVSSGTVEVIKDIEISVEGKDVIIVEDIVDTGLTLTHVHRLISSRGPRSIRVAALLEKPESRKYQGKVDYVGFQIPNRFVIGYGLDHAQLYRNFPDIRVFDEEFVQE